MDGLKILSNAFIPPGTQALVRNGVVVCTCQIGDPIEDAVADGIIMHPSDIARLDAEADKRNAGGRKATLLLVAAISAALLSGTGVAFIGKTAQADQPILCAEID